jgi:5'-nucleotidase
MDRMTSLTTRGTRPRSLVATLLILLGLLLALSPIGLGSAGAAAPTVDIQVLDVSDWHGQLDPLQINNVNIGGAASLSTYFKQDRAANPNTLTLTAGDAFGAAPPLSNFFDDEPAVLAMNLMGFDADTFGNHNFDKGIAYLQNLIDLADFQYVSANLRNRDAELDGVESYHIFDVGGVNVAVIGLTNPEAPSLVFPGSFGTIVPTDPVAAANKARAQARRDGANVFIIICHMGVTSFVSGQPAGPLIDLANAVGGFDLIVGDHTDVQYSGYVNNQLVVENKSKGATYSRTTLTVDTSNGRVIDSENSFIVPVSSAVTADPAIVAMLAPYRTALAAVFDGVIGVATDLFPRGGTPSVERSGEAAIGNLLTDAMRARYGTQLAFTNSGGIRKALPSDYAPLNFALRRLAAPYVIGPPYDLVIGDVYAVLPFGNQTVTRTVTGAQLWAMLENGVSQISPTTCTGADGRFPQISGFKFSFQCSAPPGSRVLSVALMDNTPIPEDGTTYTITVVDFINAGGDFYTMLADGQGVTRELMAQVLQEYIDNAGTITPTIEGRITKVP